MRLQHSTAEISSKLGKMVPAMLTDPAFCALAFCRMLRQRLRTRQARSQIGSSSAFMKPSVCASFQTRWEVEYSNITMFRIDGPERQFSHVST